MFRSSFHQYDPCPGGHPPVQEVRERGHGARTAFGHGGPAALCLLLLVSASLLAAGPERASVWRDRAITVDGSDAEWQGLTTPLKGTRVALGFVNDGEAVYACLLAKDVAARDVIATRGLVVWLDRETGARQTFGVRFPAGLRPGERPPVLRPVEGAAEPETARPLQEIEVYGPGKSDIRRLPNDGTGGIEVRVAVRNGVLVYELKAPLAVTETSPCAVGAAPGNVLRVTLETPGDWGPYRPVLPLGGSVGGIVGGRGSRVSVGVGGSYPGGLGPGGLVPFDVKTTVQLARPPVR